MLAPKRIRHRKVQRGSMKGKAKGYTSCITASTASRLRGSLDYQPPDRGRSYRYDSLHEAWR